MLQATWSRWMLAAIVTLSLVALLAWARNDPGVDDRDPDPPHATEVVTGGATVPSPAAPVVTDGAGPPPTT